MAAHLTVVMLGDLGKSTSKSKAPANGTDVGLALARNDGRAFHGGLNCGIPFMHLPIMVTGNGQITARARK